MSAKLYEYNQKIKKAVSCGYGAEFNEKESKILRNWA